jgi:hypothetical protein
MSSADNHRYLGSNLVYSVGAGKISNFVRVSHSNIKCGFRGLLNANAWLVFSSYWPALRRLHRWRDSGSRISFNVVVEVNRVHRTTA